MLSNISNIWKNKPNKGRESKNILFSLYGSKRGIGFPFHLEFLYLLTAATTHDYKHDVHVLRDWSHEFSKKGKLSMYTVFCCNSSLLNSQVNFAKASMSSVILAGLADKL